MTFEEFQNTKRWVTNLREAMPDHCWYDYELPVCGYIYEGDLYIAEVLPHWSQNAQTSGCWCLPAFCFGDKDTLSEDLTALEWQVWRDASAHGLL